MQGGAWLGLGILLGCLPATANTERLHGRGDAIETHIDSTIRESDQIQFNPITRPGFCRWRRGGGCSSSSHGDETKSVNQRCLPKRPTQLNNPFCLPNEANDKEGRLQIKSFDRTANQLVGRAEQLARAELVGWKRHGFWRPRQQFEHCH